MPLVIFRGDRDRVLMCIAQADISTEICKVIAEKTDGKVVVRAEPRRMIEIPGGYNAWGLHVEIYPFLREKKLPEDTALKLSKELQITKEQRDKASFYGDVYFFVMPPIQAAKDGEPI